MNLKKSTPTTSGASNQTQVKITQCVDRKVTSAEQQAIDEQLAITIIVNNISARFLDSLEFRTLITMLNKTYKPLTRWSFSNSVLRNLSDKANIAKFNFMTDKAENGNIILDGWTDISGNSVYAFMFACRDVEYTLDIVHFKERPTSENLFEKVKDVMADVHIYCYRWR